MNLVYFNVNEEGLAYQRHKHLDEALSVLEQFPNDVVIVCYEDSPTDDSMPMAEGDGPFYGLDPR